MVASAKPYKQPRAHAVLLKSSTVMMLCIPPRSLFIRRASTCGNIKSLMTCSEQHLLRVSLFDRNYARYGSVFDKGFGIGVCLSGAFDLALREFEPNWLAGTNLL